MDDDLYRRRVRRELSAFPQIVRFWGAMQYRGSKDDVNA